MPCRKLRDAFRSWSWNVSFGFFNRIGDALDSNMQGVNAFCIWHEWETPWNTMKHCVSHLQKGSFWDQNTQVHCHHRPIGGGCCVGVITEPWSKPRFVIPRKDGTRSRTKASRWSCFASCFLVKQISLFWKAPGSPKWLLAAWLLDFEVDRFLKNSWTLAILDQLWKPWERHQKHGDPQKLSLITKNQNTNAFFVGFLSLLISTQKSVKTK